MPQLPYYCLPTGSTQTETTEDGSLKVTQAVTIIDAGGHNVGSDVASCTLASVTAKAATSEEDQKSVKDTIKLLLDGDYKRIVAKWEDKDSLKFLAQQAVSEMIE